MVDQKIQVRSGRNVTYLRLIFKMATVRENCSDNDYIPSKITFKDSLAFISMIVKETAYSRKKQLVSSDTCYVFPASLRKTVVETVETSGFDLL